MITLFEKNLEQIPFPVIFIIGNGFDLKLDMKTSYNHVYEGYVKEPSNNAVIEAFKDDLSRRTPYDKWSDFEMGMAEYAGKMSSEKELIECVRDFKGYMVRHLRLENQRMVDLIRDKAYSDQLVRELNRSLEQFYAAFSPNISSQLRRLILESIPGYNIITFNYTSVLEELLALKERRQNITVTKPLHIHGSLERDVVLGVDNVEQIKCSGYSISNKGERAFVKTRFNEQYDMSRVLRAKKMISESSIICTYGFSMGDSDKTWVEHILNWLYNSASHHLVVFQHDETEYDLHNFDYIMDIEEAKKENLLEKIGIKDKTIFGQIHIPVGIDIFNFEFIKVIENSLPRGQSYNVFESFGR